MKRSRGADEKEASGQNGTSRPSREDQQLSEEEEGGDSGSTDLQDDSNDPAANALRKKIRSKYRDLINSMQRE